MDLPQNAFKRALAAGKQQIGLWCTLANPYAVEIVAGTGFDWLLLDTEHSPSEVETVLRQLQAAAPYHGSAIVRPASNDGVIIKRMLDVGAQSLLIPYVQTIEEAQYAVAATRYAPAGFRGVSALTRATRFGRVANYATQAHTEICVLVQIETQAGLDNLEGIAGVDGVDGVFIGPADLAASLGYPGQPGDPAVVKEIETAIARIRACGKPAGILTPDQAFADQCIAWGTTFTAVGIDIGILARGADALRKRFTPA